MQHHTSRALALETVSLTKRFGSFIALADVTVNVAPGSVHALLGENGAGKSTLAKCVAGSHQPDSGKVLLDGRQEEISSPIVARALGIGMACQHFMLAPGMSVAENLVLAARRMPAVINWKSEFAALASFMTHTPFSLDLSTKPSALAAGEKQKLELLKQLYLRPRLLILDEPTSALSPQEADKVLAYVRALARRGECTVLMITHKFREVMAYADEVTVLRHGQAVFSAMVTMTTPGQLAQAMVGESAAQALAVRTRDDAKSRMSLPVDAPLALQVQRLSVDSDHATTAVHDLSLEVRRGEVLGIAGVSGNGQREFFEALVGQRMRAGGRVRVMGQAYDATRAQNRELRLRALTEEPLRNACVDKMSVSQNMALRDFDQAPLRQAWLRFSNWRKRARRWMAEYGVKAHSENAPMASLSGGNVQRTLLARELAGEVNLLIATNPASGLDFAATAEVHSRIMQLRDRGGAILLISEDLDELLALSDRIAVMSEGRLVFETATLNADRQTIGTHMGGSTPLVA